MNILFGFIFILNLNLSASTDTIPGFHTEYDSPVFEVAEHFFNSKGRWTGPQPGGKGIVNYGPVGNQKVFSLVAVVSFVYDRLNIEAQNRIYGGSLIQQLELAHKSLQRSTGILLKYNIYTNETGAPNLYSLNNVEAMGVGTTPEQALALQPLMGIKRNDYSTAYPILTAHYVFIAKDTNGHVTLSKIKDPFVNNLIEKANAIKIESLKNRESLSHYSNENIKTFDFAQAWQKHYDDHRLTIQKSQYNDQINELNGLMQKYQSEYQQLHTEYKNAQSLSGALNTLISFIDVCEHISEKLTQNSSKTQEKEKGLFKSQRSFTDKKQAELTPKLKISKDQLLKTDSQLRLYYKSIQLPPPAKITLP